ncbi:dihydroxyacetone kinase family protein [Paraburkholderia hospita]|uniref:Dihydroxyacetone kinase n=1 Tax=Paraburkholderia hospita TaxID=169430 RepID=A0AAN1JHR3_9BURK|nr:dihydroxyacetone kinase family protein [Paraburkholderia hospita]AUT74056.1 dihydroxyacetone kinase subunit DhaK [Paraburkholderia hospita]EIN02966.1 dihydroxyacetone kinase [Paraburkholderia hospita]OUL78674.1 dihydroxyacetone kinase subunit DhaK [Paraburkholderia hospita]OUL85879.1 dihydroxyacetone kinase subunit DhaK [Paraburkholderia hospita]SEH45281.1 homodimeric dihydroxyacetone kinase [Paraburkholderia hospita]
MKKLLNDPSRVVREMLEGLEMLAPDTALLRDANVVVRRDLPEPHARRVAIISGGGSGHEPAHAGYVGDGMLAAAVCGEVFTSPSTDAVLAAIHASAGPNGALLVVKNYTGDRLNFGLAAELARAEGIPVEVVVVADDVSLRNTVERGRRRGIAGTVFVHKIAGAAAAAGKTLADVAAIARSAADAIGTMGVALDGCTLPATQQSSFSLADDEIELGLGIHGEKGVQRTKPMPADQLTDTLLTAITDDLQLASGERVALLVNGLGATTPMELAVVARAAINGLKQRGLRIERAWCGTLLSALNMPGCSISVMRVDDERLALLDAPTKVATWPGAGRVNVDGATGIASGAVDDAVASSREAAVERTPLQLAFDAAARALIDDEARLTELDSKAGDGDLGSSMTRAGEAVLAIPATAWPSAADALADLAVTLRRAIAGSSGPFYATALLRASRRLGESNAPAASDWAAAFDLAVKAISELGGAQPGERTMLDALRPAADAFTEATGRGESLAAAWAATVDAAEKGAASTASMMPRVGRASYLGERAVGEPDGGAVAVVCWLRALTPFVR